MFPLRNLKRFVHKACQQPGYAAKVLYRRLMAQGYYHWGRGRSGFPEAVTLFLTHRCNLRCKMCGQWGESGVTKSFEGDVVRQEMSFDQLRSFVDDVAVMKTNFTLFGGEPLMHPHCADLVRYIKGKGLHCLMITNGSMLGKFAKDLVAAGLDELNVSLDGGPGLHDEIRGLPGLFERIVSGLAQVAAIKKDMGVDKPLVNLQCTITKYNYHHLEQLTEVARQVGANALTYHNLIFLGRDLIERQKNVDRQLGSSSREWEGFVFDPEIDVECLFEKMQAVKSETYSFAVDFYPNFSRQALKEYYEKPSYLPSEYSARCFSPWMTAYVFPDGEVRPCLNSSYSFGNVSRDTFTEVWNSDKAVHFRNFLKKDKIFPACVRCTELYRY